jgi:anti-sigma factor RsiW
VTCSHILDLVEAIAAGDIDVDPATTAHLETCPRCASALASARRVEAALAARPAPSAPVRFRSMVLQRIRREQWRAEQHVDRLFNVAVAVAMLLVVGGVAALMNLGGLLSAVSGLLAVFSDVSTEMLRTAAPTVNTYIAAAALLLSALGMWWWADRTLSL